MAFSSLKAMSYNLPGFNKNPDLLTLIKEFEDRIHWQTSREEGIEKSSFISFAETDILSELRQKDKDKPWIDDNHERFINDTPNIERNDVNFLSEFGFITSLAYSPDGEFVVVCHSTGLIQCNKPRLRLMSICRLGHLWKIQLVHKMDETTSDGLNRIISEYAKNIRSRYKNENSTNTWFPMFSQGLNKHREYAWVNECNEKFLKGTRNRVLYDRWFFSECGAVTALSYSRDGTLIVVGHATGLIQLRHGGTGVVLSTLRNIQFPPKPIYALQFSPHDARVCYAACTDGVVYRIEVPNIEASVADPPEHCIRSDPALESLSRQFYGSPGTATASMPFVSHRSPALSLGILAEEAKLVVGYADASIKVFDMETQEVESTYKVHKLRVQYIPPKLQRMHVGQVCAISTHPQREHTFASGAWDNTLRIWDKRVKIGCMMTFEGVNVCGDSIDLNRDHCLVGSWQPTEALTVWDLAAKKRLNIIRVQNRRPDVDGEYIYACRYWRSDEFNRKGKYGLIGGSGTNSVEVINLHNRYISASYPAPGSVLAIASHGDRVAYGGTAPVFSIVSFHDPKHEPYPVADVDNDPWTWVRDTAAVYEVDDIMIDMEPVPNYDYPIRDDIEF